MSLLNEKLLVGAFITSVEQVGEVVDFSNAVSFQPKTLAELTEYLTEIDNRMIPVVSADAYFFNNNLNQYLNQNKQPLLDAIAASGHVGRIVLCFDEPLWRVRRAHNGDAAHEQTLQVLTEIVADYHEFEFLQVEAYADIYSQLADSGQLRLIYSANYIGFDCYGPFSLCGDDVYGKMPQIDVLAEIHKEIINNASHAKLFLAPGVFSSENADLFADGLEMVEQFYEYKRIAARYPGIIGGIGVFTWGDMTGGQTAFVGARNTPIMRGVIKHEFLQLMNRGV